MNSVHNVPANSEAVRAAIPVRALVSGRKLAPAEDLVRLRLCLNWKLRVDRARVDEQRRLRGRQVFLSHKQRQPNPGASSAHLTHLEVIGDLQERRVRDADDVHLAVVRKVERGARAIAEPDGADLRDAVRLERGGAGSTAPDRFFL